MLIKSSAVCEQVQPRWYRLRVFGREPVRKVYLRMIRDGARVWDCVTVDGERFQLEGSLLGADGVVNDCTEPACLEG